MKSLCWLPSALLLTSLLLLAACVPMAVSPPAARTRVMSPAGPPPPPVMAPPPPVIVTLTPPSSYVVFFSEPNYRGESFTIEAGAGVENLARLDGPRGSWNDRISSFRIEGVATVVAFTDTNFRGERLETASSLGDLVAERRNGGPRANWDQVISSLRVLPTRTRGFDPEPRFDSRTADNVVRRVYRDTLLREPDAEGLRFYRDKLVNEGWTEEMLRERMRQSPEFHAINPDEVITRAYREVLKRDPDPEGLRHYREMLVGRGWTEPQLRADLLRSSEEHNAAIRDLVTRAYRGVLGRDPDPEGAARYGQLVRDKGWSEHQVRDALMKSDEYRQKHNGR